MRVLRLPEDLRDELKAPLGTLYRCDGLECVKKMKEELRRATMVLAVGDITAFYLLEGSVTPDIIIVDHKTKRAPIHDHVKAGIHQPDYELVEVDNPAATLTQEFIDLIRERLESRRPTRIVVNGEEDLAALPVILYAPIGSAVVYGQPNEGSVLVRVTPEKKAHIDNLMKRMTVED
ncbi:MAG: DUF359 domain-containing protein [Methanosarcinales archaeon]|nr:DUF359 domain-containing protein [Methanosarcinales archaeon]